MNYNFVIHSTGHKKSEFYVAFTNNSNKPPLFSTINYPSHESCIAFIKILKENCKDAGVINAPVKTVDLTKVD